jgi:hypothetical protein
VLLAATIYACTMFTKEQLERASRRRSDVVKRIRRSTLPRHFKSFVLDFLSWVGPVSCYEVAWPSQPSQAKSLGYALDANNGKRESRSIRRKVAIMKQIGAVQVFCMGAEEARRWWQRRYPNSTLPKSFSDRHRQNFYVFNWDADLFVKGTIENFNELWLKACFKKVNTNTDTNTDTGVRVEHGHRCPGRKNKTRTVSVASPLVSQSTQVPPPALDSEAPLTHVDSVVPTSLDKSRQDQAYETRVGCATSCFSNLNPPILEESAGSEDMAQKLSDEEVEFIEHAAAVRGSALPLPLQLQRSADPLILGVPPAPNRFGSLMSETMNRLQSERELARAVLAARFAHLPDWGRQR